MVKIIKIIAFEMEFNKWLIVFELNSSETYAILTFEHLNLDFFLA
jgi:hypothetical protein